MTAPSLGPAAFLSYAHDDDELGDISRFRKRLEFEIKRHLGRKFPIFFDRHDLGWGEQWRPRIEAVLGEVTFLIPILSPSFFSSPECRHEVETFMRREQQLGRDDLILPVYFIDTPLLDDRDALVHDALASTLVAHQYADWRKLRHDVEGKSVSVSRAMTRLAMRVRDTVGRIEAARGVAAAPVGGPVAQGSPDLRGAERAGAGEARGRVPIRGPGEGEPRRAPAAEHPAAGGRPHLATPRPEARGAPDAQPAAPARETASLDPAPLPGPLLAAPLPRDDSSRSSGPRTFSRLPKARGAPGAQPAAPVRKAAPQELPPLPGPLRVALPPRDESSRSAGSTTFFRLPTLVARTAGAARGIGRRAALGLWAARGPAALAVTAGAVLLATSAAFRTASPLGLPLLHLWALPPVNAPLPCPPPAIGQPADASGYYDPARLAELWRTMAAVTAAGVVLMVLACYQLPRRSLNPAFVRLWYGCLAGAALFSSVVPLGVAALAPARAMAGTCTTRIAPFLVRLPPSLVVPRALAGALWGMAAFVAVSLVATRLLARGPRAGGFFHYRGCPWPRWR